MRHRKRKIQFARRVVKKNPNINKKELARVLGISRNSLYYKQRKKLQDFLLKTSIEVLHILDPYYGQRRIGYALQRNRKPVRRIMQIYEIYGRTRKRKYYKAGDRNLAPMGVQNQKKNLEIQKIHQVWSSDFTYLNYKEKQFYLATIIDELSKQIVGFTLGFHHGKELILGALKNAIQRSKTTPNILHSDQGSEYRSYEYFDTLKRYNISASMSKKSSPWENNTQESFYGKFKFELGNLNRFESIEKVIEAIHLHIYYYNNIRIHTSLKMSPKEFEKQLLNS